MTAAKTAPPITNKTAIAAAELRLGNYVKAPLGEIMKVDVLGHLDNPNYIHASNETGFGQNGFEPIELTPEILEKAGFEKPANSWIGDKFHLSEWDDYPLNWCVALNKNNAILVLKLKYVHQLQNLYFALTGEELPLTL